MFGWGGGEGKLPTPTRLDPAVCAQCAYGHVCCMCMYKYHIDISTKRGEFFTGH